jgi:hypothetical protein
MSDAQRLMVSAVFLWLGRALAVLLCLFWGAFFVEHLAEWFVPGQPGGWPPPSVWAAQAFHFVMLAGLALMAWRAKPGAVLTVLGTALFFATIGMARFPTIALVNLLPLLALATSWATAPAPKAKGL